MLPCWTMRDISPLVIRYFHWCNLKYKTRNLISDIDDHRLHVALDHGADHVIKVTHKDHQLLAEEIRRMLGDNPQVALECSGSDDSVCTAIYVRSFYSHFCVGILIETVGKYFVQQTMFEFFAMINFWQNVRDLAGKKTKGNWSLKW